LAKRSPLAEKLDEVKDRIAAACAKAKRDPADVTLIAVTKTAAPEQMREIIRNPTRWDRNLHRVRQTVIGWLGGVPAEARA